MANSVFDSNLQLLGNNIAKCHQLIDEALKVSSLGQNENAHSHRIRRLCNSQQEQKKGRSLRNSTACSKATAGTTGSSNVGPKSNSIINRKPNHIASISGSSKNLQNYKIFSATKSISGNKHNPPRLAKTRCPPAGTSRAKPARTLTSERLKPCTNVLREQNDVAKTSESDTDVNQYILCDENKKMAADSMRMMTQDRFLQAHSEKTGSSFSIFNPVRTLHFLLEELEGKIFPLSDNNVKRILVEMEETLQRIPVNNKNTSPLTAVNLRNAAYECEPPQKLSKLNAILEETGRRPLDAGENPSNENLHLKLEHSCSKLEKACQEMEKACSELKKEKDYYKNELHIKKKAYEELLKKESGYIATINDLKQNLLDMTAKADEHTKSIENLNIVLNQLQEENKVVTALKDLHKKLNARIREATKETEQLRSELQISNLEREKLSLLLTSRDEELAKLKQDFGEVQEFVADQLVNTSIKNAAIPSNFNFSAASEESLPLRVVNPTPDSENVTAKSSLCFRSSMPVGWHPMNSDVINSTALKTMTKTPSTDTKKNLTATNLIDSIRMLISEMKHEPVIELKQSAPNFDMIEKYVVPQLSDVSMSSQHSGHDISQLSSLSGLTL